jgi:MFS family permease
MLWPLGPCSQPQPNRSPPSGRPARRPRGRSSIGVAILRYRLDEIDRLINRTLVYGLLSVVLGLGYAAGSLVFVLLAGAGTGPPSWLVAAATLAAAAIFRPARRRIQAAVDRRFNRRRYNTAQTIAAFSTRLRAQIDLDTLSTELLAIVDQTMEPTRVSVWLRASPPRSSGTAPSDVRPTRWAY